MKKPIEKVAQELNLKSEHLELYGNDKAKISLKSRTSVKPSAKLILVSAITPTPAGEGKTTVSIGLAQGLRKQGQRVALALRQPSMGPVFGRKGTATGGGKSTLTPAESINLHFTGDFHAITSAHCLLAAIVDNALHFKTTRLDPHRVTFKRVMDINDRALRNIRVAINENHLQGRASGFDITAASEIMAIVCLSENYEDLRERLKKIVVGFTPDMQAVLADEMKVTGSMLALLRDAIKPNLVQSIEGVPAFVHGGPFANIAHGCNSVLGTQMALEHSEYVVTEAGFGFDLGGEKFIDIKCRQSGLSFDVLVLVVTVRALKMHGGAHLSDLNLENPEALIRGMENLDAHLDAAAFFGRPIIVAVNRFESDQPGELSLILQHCELRQVSCSFADVYGLGGDGALELASKVIEACQIPVGPLPFIYSLSEPLESKVEKIATRIYGASGVDLSEDALAKLEVIRANGFENLPICMAKTHESLSDDRKLLGRPRDFRISIRDFEIANGAGYLVALTGKLLRMPALPKAPAAERIQMDEFGNITGW